MTDALAQDLAGKAVLITGASTGIGAAVALAGVSLARSAAPPPAE